MANPQHDVLNKTSSSDDVHDAPKQNTEEEEKPTDTEAQTLCSSWHDHTYRSKFMYTLYITAGFGVLGFCVGQRGPSFLDLQIITDTDLKRGSAFFTAGSIGYLLGSLVGGVAYEKVNKIILMFVAVFGLGVLTGILPFCSPYGLMVAIHLVTGMFMGVLDTCGNAELVRTWGVEGRSAMQTAHFSFALGGVISPLITKPFLSPLPPEDVNTTTVPSVVIMTENISSAITATPNYNVSTFSPVEEKQTTIVFYAYLISAVITVIVAFPFLITYFKVKSQMKKRTAGEAEVPIKREFSLPIFFFTLILICVMYMLYCCVEDSFAAYLMTFVVKSQHWTKSTGTLLTSVFWAAFAFGRFCGILFVKWISSVKLLFLCCIFLIISQIGFLISAHFHVDVGIWICAVGSGMSMSVFFPTGLTWTEEELVKMSGRVSSAILISASSGTMVNPILLGYLMEALDPMWYTYLLTAESVICTMVFLTLLIFARTFLKKRRCSLNITKEVIVNGTQSTVDQKFI